MNSIDVFIRLADCDKQIAHYEGPVPKMHEVLRVHDHHGQSSASFEVIGIHYHIEASFPETVSSSFERMKHTLAGVAVYVRGIA